MVVTQIGSTRHEEHKYRAGRTTKKRNAPLACEVAPANVPPLALSDEIVRVGLGPPQVLPSTQPLSKEAQRQGATRTRTPGWLARLIRVHHLAGKRLGSEVPADPLISIAGCSHYQREVLQLPLQHGDRAA